MTLQEEYKQERKAEIQEQIDPIEKELVTFYKWYQEQEEQGKNVFHRTLRYQTNDIATQERKLKRLKWKLNPNNIGSGISDLDIIEAKAHDWRDLIDTNRSGLAKCPFHDDSSPSMLVKNGYAYCFACCKSWDTIQFSMDKDGLRFIEAVKFLIG